MMLATYEEKIVEAQKKAYTLFKEVEARELVQPGLTELELSNAVFQLADELFGIKKYWHKRIVRSGRNTVETYRANPPNLTIQSQDILFFDFGPIFEDFEADFGKTYVLGDNAKQEKVLADLEAVFQAGRQFFQEKPMATGAELYAFICESSYSLGWVYGNEHCGHLIGEFPHERNFGECPHNYLCPDNHYPLKRMESDGTPSHWILEVHLLNQEKTWGGFFEDLLTL